jgi:hypothetical protein
LPACRSTPTGVSPRWSRSPGSTAP